MSVCPGCSGASLVIEHALELGPDGDSDEISIQALRCAACGFCAAASYEESRRGSLDRECWRHSAARITPEHYAQLAATLAACPAPRDAECSCNAHRWFGQKVEGWKIRPLNFVPLIEGSGFEPEPNP